MNYLAITKNDMLNGVGLRVVLWVAGCSHNCEGCHNPSSHNPEAGVKFTEKEKYEIIKELSNDYIDGITFSGGDPFHNNNIKEVCEFIQEIKTIYPKKTVWVYTGYRLRQIHNRIKGYLKYIDVIVDGKYVSYVKSPNAPWIGSSNQKIIDVKSIASKIVYCSNISIII